MLFDEVRYLPLAEDAGHLPFKLINARYEKESNIFTTNQGFEKWGSVLGDEVMVTAMLDRILIRDHVVNIRGGSYRMSQYQAMYGFQQ